MYKCELFTFAHLPARLQRAMREGREQGKICDFTIQVEDRSYEVHKDLLAAASDYFRSLFTHNVVENQENKVVLEDVCVSAIDSIIGFCYHERMIIHRNNIEQILITASRLQMVEIEQFCAKYISNGMDITNCIAILDFAEE